MRLRRNSPSKKPLLIRSVRARQRSGGQKASHLKKARYRQRLVLPVSRQRSRRLRPSFAIFSKGRSSFQSWLRRLKTWNGRRKWMLRITSISRHRSKRRGSTRLWTPPKCPTLARSSGLPLPCLETKKRNKIALGLAGGGIALGIALALLRGLVLNQTVGRPLQLETQLHIPLMLSIPYANGQFALPRNGSPANPEALATRRHHPKLAPWEAGHFIRPYCDAIRDRLGLYFELNHLTHKPKLVGVTGFSEEAGTSTLAAGLAASLSETNDGKVLLVDVNLGPQEVHPFFKGKPAYPLNAALKPDDTIASASENLYLATVGSPNAGPAQLGLKKFFDMMPNLKASDFDYIIFDMPPLAQTSPTWGMAAFMDKLLLVVEAEKNNRELIKRSYGKLLAERNNVAVVVNKARSYVPKWLDSES